MQKQEKTLFKTPLHSFHLQKKARMVPFAGYEMPVQYTSVLEETKIVRSHAGLFDVSHMGQFSLQGKTALAALNKIVTNDLSKIAIGQAQYNLICNEEGGIIDDLVVYKLAQDSLYLCVNASNREKDRDWIKEHLPKEVSFSDESEETALIALQGPLSESILIQVISKSIQLKSEKTDSQQLRITSLPYYWSTRIELLGVSCLISRTGYTGEDGFEIYLPANSALSIWEGLLEFGRSKNLHPIGLGARDTLRIEMGYPLHGQEISPQISPFAAGLHWVVKMQKEASFPGKTKLLEEIKAGGSTKQLKAFILSEKRIGRTDYPILDQNKKKIGSITSGTFSPHLEKSIALGFIQKENLAESCFFIDVRNTIIPANITPLPFVPSQTRSIKKQGNI